MPLTQRFNRLKLIQKLDPTQDYEQIYHFLTGYEFSWDINKALELALMKTFCVPSISKILDKTGEFHHHGQKRYDDTALIVSRMVKYGYLLGEGKAALQRMNQIHQHFLIKNEDYLYVLSGFIYEPIRWIERFGWRPLCETEKLAMYYFWCAVGQEMGIKDIPENYALFEQYNQSYEQQYFRYCAANARVGESTVQIFLHWFPAVFRPALRPLIYAMFDESMLEAFGLPSLPAYQRSIVTNTLKWRGYLLRYFPPRQRPDFYLDRQHLSYPGGHTLKDVGPLAMLEELNRE
ncbi:oxygenase MpaB family protein [Spirulina subsalsa]|uniref:oxygenase MpaB family protein n=1 Tax=Spirulina subsalsa TaxID=54311 RepID=UPI0003135FAC|nr:oxygenase MpaB family protein [Spirulina subsalsa]